MHVKNNKRERISKYVEPIPKRVSTQVRGWTVPCDGKLLVTQNELDENDAKQLAANGCFCVSEVPICHPPAPKYFMPTRYSMRRVKHQMQVGWPFGLEMAQNSTLQLDSRRIGWAFTGDYVWHTQSCIDYGQMEIISIMKKGPISWLLKLPMPCLHKEWSREYFSRRIWATIWKPKILLILCAAVIYSQPARWSSTLFWTNYSCAFWWRW